MFVPTSLTAVASWTRFGSSCRATHDLQTINDQADHLAFEEGRKRQGRGGRILGDQIADRLDKPSMQWLIEIGRRHERGDLVIARI